MAQPIPVAQPYGAPPTYQGNPGIPVAQAVPMGQPVAQAMPAGGQAYAVQQTQPAYAVTTMNAMSVVQPANQARPATLVRSQSMANYVPGGAYVVKNVSEPPPAPVSCGWTWLFLILGFLFPVLWIIGAFFACCGPAQERQGGKACLCMLILGVIILSIVLSLDYADTCDTDYGDDDFFFNCGQVSDEVCCEEYDCTWYSASNSTSLYYSYCGY